MDALLQSWNNWDVFSKREQPKSLFRKEGFPPNKLADRQGDLICFYHKPAKQLVVQKGAKKTKKTTTDPHAKTLRRKEKKF